MEHNQYPITFVDYSIVVPMPGIILMDSELKPDQLCVKNGDTFEVVIADGRIRFVGKDRKKD